MKLTEKIKNKFRAVKDECRRFTPSTYAEWLNDNGLTDNGENRALYGSYVLETDEKNKKADMRLSQFIGRGVFLLVCLVLFVVMFCNSVGATDIAFATNLPNDIVSEGFVTAGVVLDLPYEYNITTFVTNYDGNYEYFYIVDNPHALVESIDNYAQHEPVTQELCFEYFDGFYNNFSCDAYDIGLDENSRALFLYYSCRDYVTDLDIKYQQGLQNGYDDGYDVGRNDGYDVGYNDGLKLGETAKKSIFAIFDAPVKVLTSLLDFEIFGVNFLEIFKVIFTILLLGVIAKFVLGIAL